MVGIAEFVREKKTETVSDELIYSATETENWFHLVHLDTVVA